MRLTNTQIAIICLIVANIIWGATSPIFKWTLQDIPPFTFGFLRFFLSAIILFPFTYKHLKIKRDDIMMLFFLGIIGTAFRIAYNTYGLKLAPSINELIISSTAPVFLIMVAIAIFHEKTNKKVVTGTIISFTGILLIIFQPLFVHGFNISSLTGNIYFMVAMCLNVCYILLLKELAPKYRVMTLLFWTFVLAAITLSPFAGFEMSKNGFLTHLTSQGIIGISFAVVMSTLVAYMLNLHGIKYMKASEVGIFTYVDPFVGIAVAHSLLGETLTVIFFLGAAMIFIGIFIAEGRIHYHPIHLLRRKEEPVIPAVEKQLAPVENIS